MRKQYHFFKEAGRLDAWDVDRLIELSSALEPAAISIETLHEIDEDYWFEGASRPTVRQFVEHMRLVERVEIAYPIILAADGRVMDGMHRVARALLENKTTIMAVRFTTTPPPDYQGVRPDELSYERP